MPANSGGGNSDLANQEFEKAVRAQEDKVEERRKVLSTIVRTKGIIYKGQDSFYGQSGADEEVMKDDAREGVHQARPRRSRLRRRQSGISSRIINYFKPSSSSKSSNPSPSKVRDEGFARNEASAAPEQATIGRYLSPRIQAVAIQPRAWNEENQGAEHARQTSGRACFPSSAAQASAEPALPAPASSPVMPGIARHHSQWHVAGLAGEEVLSSHKLGTIEDAPESKAIAWSGQRRRCVHFIVGSDRRKSFLQREQPQQHRCDPQQSDPAQAREKARRREKPNPTGNHRSSQPKKP